MANLLRPVQIEELSLPGSIEATGIAMLCYIEDALPELEDRAIIPLCGNAALQLPLRVGFDSMEALRAFFPVGFRVSLKEPVISFSRGKRMLAVSSYEDVQFEGLSFELQSCGFQELRRHGNVAYKEQKLQLARLYYTEALHRAGTYSEVVAAASNRAEIALKLHYPDEAILSADAVPTHAKSLLRKAKALCLVGERYQALRCVREAISHAAPGVRIMGTLRRFEAELVNYDPRSYFDDNLPTVSDFLGPVKLCGRRSIRAVKDVEAGELLMGKSGVFVTYRGDESKQELVEEVIRRTTSNKRLADQLVALSTRDQPTSFFGSDVGYYPISESSGLNRASVLPIVDKHAILCDGYVGVWGLASLVNRSTCFNAKFAVVVNGDQRLLTLRSTQKIDAGSHVAAAFEPSSVGWIDVDTKLPGFDPDHSGTTTIAAKDEHGNLYLCSDARVTLGSDPDEGANSFKILKISKDWFVAIAGNAGFGKLILAQTLIELRKLERPWLVENVDECCKSGFELCKASFDKWAECDGADKTFWNAALTFSSIYGAILVDFSAMLVKEMQNKYYVCSIVPEVMETNGFLVAGSGHRFAQISWGKTVGLDFPERVADLFCFSSFMDRHTGYRVDLIAIGNRGDVSVIGAQIHQHFTKHFIDQWSIFLALQNIFVCEVLLEEDMRKYRDEFLVDHDKLAAKLSNLQTAVLRKWTIPSEVTDEVSSDVARSSDGLPSDGASTSEGVPSDSASTSEGLPSDSASAPNEQCKTVNPAATLNEG